MNERRFTCRDVCEHADLVLEGNITCPEWDSLREHLRLCPPCEEYVRQIGITIEAVRCLPKGAPESSRARLLECFEAWLAGRGCGPGGKED